jgi:hypothetical protein
MLVYNKEGSFYSPLYFKKDKTSIFTNYTNKNFPRAKTLGY